MNWNCERKDESYSAHIKTATALYTNVGQDVTALWSVPHSVNRHPLSLSYVLFFKGNFFTSGLLLLMKFPLPLKFILICVRLSNVYALRCFETIAFVFLLVFQCTMSQRNRNRGKLFNVRGLSCLPEVICYCKIMLVCILFTPPLPCSTPGTENMFSYSPKSDLRTFNHLGEGGNI